MTKSSMMDAINRGTIRLLPSEVRECEKMMSFIREHPGCVRRDIKEHMRTSRISTYIQIGLAYG